MMNFTALRLTQSLSIVATVMIGYSQNVDTVVERPATEAASLVNQVEPCQTEIEAYMHHYPLVTTELTRRDWHLIGFLAD
jgi:ADP-dependent phosphofructokinase/glucokinase